MTKLLGEEAVEMTPYFGMTITLDPDPESGVWREVKTGTRFVIEAFPRSFKATYRNPEDTDGPLFPQIYMAMPGYGQSFRDMLDYRAANAERLQPVLKWVRRQCTAS